MRNLLVKTLGSSATLLHGDTLVVDRWMWLKKRLPATKNQERLLDVGCGSGAFTIHAAKRGYKGTGISWSEDASHISSKRASMLGVGDMCEFKVVDVRDLDKFSEFKEAFDVVLNFENIEHIINDRKLMIDIAACLKPGGRLLATTPNYFYKSMTQQDLGPFKQIEDGAHVRRGYTSSMLEELCSQAGLKVTSISYCSGFFSQKITALMRTANCIHPLFSWVVTFPLRVIPVLFDRFIKYEQFSICLEAYKPRF